MNGGAVIALLTYAGNSATGDVAAKLGTTFGAYTAGLALTVASYLYAYFAQESFSSVTLREAREDLGIAKGESTADADYKAGRQRHGGGVLFAAASAVCFVLGSYFAMGAITARTDGPPTRHIQVQTAPTLPAPAHSAPVAVIPSPGRSAQR
jgi:hypothetical protein